MAVFPSVQSNPRFTFPNGGTAPSHPNEGSQQMQTPCSNSNNIPLQHTSGQPFKTAPFRKAFLTDHLSRTAYLASPPSTPPRGRRSIKGAHHRHSHSLVVTPKCSIHNLQQPTPPSVNTYPTPLHLLTTPTRAKPTLAMSMQSFAHRQRSVSPSASRIYAPTPSSPTPRSTSYSSNHNDIVRPPSRSERLLRDTLKRDEAERHAVPTLPSQHSRPPKQPRPSKSASTCGGKDEDEDPWTRGTFHFDTPKDGPGGAHLVRNKSAGNVRRSEPPPQFALRHPHNSPTTNTRRRTSPSPIRQQYTRSPNSMPGTVPHTTPCSGVTSQARSRSHSQSMGSLPAAACALTPHEAVLRSRLEKVLSMGRDEAERETVRRQKQEHEWLGQEVSIHRCKHRGFDIDRLFYVLVRELTIICRLLFPSFPIPTIQHLASPFFSHLQTQASPSSNATRLSYLLPLQCAHCSGAL